MTINQNREIQRSQLFLQVVSEAGMLRSIHRSYSSSAAPNHLLHLGGISSPHMTSGLHNSLGYCFRILPLRDCWSAENWAPRRKRFRNMFPEEAAVLKWAHAALCRLPL